MERGFNAPSYSLDMKGLIRMNKKEKMIKNLDKLIKLQEKALKDMEGVQEEINYLKEYVKYIQDASDEEIEDIYECE